MKKALAFFLSIVIALGPCNKICTISPRSANIGTAVVSTMAAAYSLLYVAHHKMDVLQSTFVVCSTTALSALFSSVFFHSLTPSAMIERAKRLLKNVESDQLFYIAMHCAHDNYEFIKSIYEVYFYSEFPLLDAFDHLVDVRCQLERAHMLLESAQYQGVEYRFVDTFRHYKSKTQGYKKQVDEALFYIRQDPNWVYSVRLGKDFSGRLNPRIYQESAMTYLP